MSKEKTPNVEIEKKCQNKQEMQKYTMNIETGQRKMSKEPINIESKENKENVKYTRNVKNKQEIQSRQ